MAKILDGIETSQEIQKDIADKINKLNYVPKLTIIQVGSDAPSNKYVSLKIKKAHSIGIDTNHIKIDDIGISTDELVEIIKNEKEKTNGIIVQLPLPSHINKELILSQIPPEKDVDGLNPQNKYVKPATPIGIISLLKKYNINLKGSICGVIGQSNLVGKPLSDILESYGARVIRMDKSTGIEKAKDVEILVVAAGQANLISKENIKENVIIVDVGINEIADKTAMTKIVGDVDKESVFEKASWISPVPGGVGPMTIISIFQNLLKLLEVQENHDNK